MSAELAKAYFERDLTDAEEQSLADWIASSPEAALELAEHARKAYVATGLPTPDWGSTASGSAALRGGILKGLILGLVLSGAVWLAWLRPVAQEAPVPDPLSSVPVSAVPPAPAARKIPSHPAPTLAPQPYVPTRRYDGLAAIVRQEAPSLVTVRVLDGKGGEVRLLYAGMLPRGEWTFEWEGLLQDGTPAPEGTYTVETQSGRSRLQKQVVIDRR